MVWAVFCGLAVVIMGSVSISDPDYLSFLEELNNPDPEKPMSMDQNLEALEKKEKERLGRGGGHCPFGDEH